ncbi:MAG: M16 family metallopeptidase, partial [Nanopusillaceae archaeon]
GPIYEEKEYRGISSFVNFLIFKSNKKYSKNDIKEILGDNGSIYDVIMKKSDSIFKILTVKNKFKDVIDVLYNCVTNLQFKDEEIEEVRLHIKNIIENINASGFKKTMHLIPLSVYGYSDYGEQIFGYENTIKNINKELLEEYKRKYYTPDNLTIFLEGNVDENDVNLLVDYFSKFEGKRDKLKNPSKDKGMNIVDRTSRPDFSYYAFSISIDKKKFSEYDPLIFLFTYGKNKLLDNILVKKYNISFNATINFTVHYDDEVILSFFLERINGYKINLINKAIEEFLNEMKSIDEKYIKNVVNNHILNNYDMMFNLNEKIWEDALLYPHTGKLYEDYYRELIDRMLNVKSKDIDEFAKIVEKVIYEGNYVIINSVDKNMFM